MSQWAAELSVQGGAGLKKAGRAGRKPYLSAEDLGKIEQVLKRGPQDLDYETGLWTADRVAHLIERECGVSHRPSQAWRILRRLGRSCQCPRGHALERDDYKIRRWRATALAGVKEKAKNDRD